MSDKKGLETEPYKGVRDFYPSDWALASAIFSKEREVLARFGFEEYQASPLERTEIYESKGNEEIINEQTYTFEDRGGRRVTLRPEMTPTLARMVANKRRDLQYPLRWFSIGNRFRYERPQKGRLREFFQTDVDMVGVPEGEADLEIVMVASEILKAFGATEKDFVFRVNSRKLLTLACRVAGIAEGTESKAYWQLIDKKAKMPKAEFEEELKKFDGDPLSIIESNSNAEVTREKEHLLAQIEELKSRGITNIVFDTDIVRGFDYYTGMVFEVYDTDPSNARSLFGGGRYDGLVSLFGGDAIPAVGFAIGDVGLRDFLETHNLLPKTGTSTEMYIATPNLDTVKDAQTFAQQLRADSVRVLVNLKDRSIGEQIKDANKRGIPYFLVYGQDEVESDTLKIKSLASETETAVKKGEVASFIKGN